jgi:hypothetical protein
LQFSISPTTTNEFGQSYPRSPMKRKSPSASQLSQFSSSPLWPRSSQDYLDVERCDGGELLSRL